MNNLFTLIQKYRAGTATENEKKQLLNFLENNDHALKEWLKESYYLDINNDTQVISEARSTEIFNKIQELKNRQSTSQRISKSRLLPITKRWIQWVAAACVIGFIATGILYYSVGKSGSNTTARSSFYELRQFRNNADTTMVVALQDGSNVFIEPKSAISFYNPFNEKRDISLIGKATFKVAKNVAYPFTVYANGISTTALGTIFSVDAFDNNVVVRLLEGKVVVKSVGVKSPDTKSVFADTYLTPGKEYFYNHEKGTYVVNRFNHLQQIDKNKAIPNKLPKANTGTNTTNALIFNRTPLLNVFAKIEQHYKIAIKYKKKSFADATFTGSFLKTDSLKNILSIICSTNDLQFKEENGLILIYK